MKLEVVGVSTMPPNKVVKGDDASNSINYSQKHDGKIISLMMHKAKKKLRFLKRKNGTGRRGSIGKSNISEDEPLFGECPGVEVVIEQVVEDQRTPLVFKDDASHALTILK